MKPRGLSGYVYVMGCDGFVKIGWVGGALSIAAKRLRR